MALQKKTGLGRGLSAILESPETDITSKDISGNYVAGAIANLPVEKIETNPFQPREDFDQAALEELAQSILEQGIIQPLTVRKMGYDKYQLISGERRYRAAQIAGIATVPCYIRVANDEQMLEWALIENIQRENLNSIEIAISYNRLIEECSLTQEELSKKVGKNRSTVTNYLRLLKLPAEVQAALRDGSISMGHARSLINIESEARQTIIARKIVAENLSVRDVEKLVRQVDKAAVSGLKIGRKPLPKKYESVKLSIREYLDRDIEFSSTPKGKGKIVIPFSSDSDLAAILNKLGIE
jgi:ParB family chromosome partitioning protein